MLLSGASFYYASNAGSASHRSANEQNITVTIASKACDPNEITIPAGQTTFRIVNASDRAVEWEILDGVMVLEERENIAPGFSQTLTARLEPGNYQITCGLLSNPHGTLHVIPSANGASQPKHQPTLKDYIGAMAEYKVYLAGEADSFIEAVGSLADAIHAGHLDEAKSLYEPARIAYAHLSPIAGPISDLDSAIDARADFFENREQDPHFTGLHRIEYGLFHQNSLDGLGAVADQLKTNATALEERIHDLRINPERMIAGSISALDRFSTAAKGQEEDRYAHISLATFNATLVGSEHAYDLIKPVIMKADPVLIRQIDADFSAVHSALDTHKAANGYVADITLSDTQRAKLQQQTAALSSELGKLLDSLRLSK
ncbi:iron uptake system protein EfeO [Allorhizobium sp. BGMRC 0089]|nr:iron uptake system protein EfeO [Allorhizobium sonneratiae]MCM2293232.1 iron uptake system protein EfeO [Allorhizobium sonneratiae]